MSSHDIVLAHTRRNCPAIPSLLAQDGRPVDGRPPSVPVVCPKGVAAVVHEGGVVCGGSVVLGGSGVVGGSSVVGAAATVQELPVWLSSQPLSNRSHPIDLTDPICSSD